MKKIMKYDVDDWNADNYVREHITSDMLKDATREEKVHMLKCLMGGWASDKDQEAMLKIMNSIEDAEEMEKVCEEAGGADKIMDKLGEQGKELDDKILASMAASINDTDERAAFIDKYGNSEIEKEADSLANKTDEALTMIRKNLKEGIFDWDVTKDELKDCVDILKKLTPDERNEVISQMSDEELKHLVNEVNSDHNGLSKDQKKEFIKVLVKGLDGEQLSRFIKQSVTWKAINGVTDYAWRLDTNLLETCLNEVASSGDATLQEKAFSAASEVCDEIKGAPKSDEKDARFKISVLMLKLKSSPEDREALALKMIRENLNEGVIDNTGENELEDCVEILKILTPDERNDVISEMSDDELQHFVDEVNEKHGGLSPEKKEELIDVIVEGLDEDELARFIKQSVTCTPVSSMASSVVVENGVDYPDGITYNTTLLGICLKKIASSDDAKLKATAFSAASEVCDFVSSEYNLDGNYAQSKIADSMLELIRSDPNGVLLALRERENDPQAKALTNWIQIEYENGNENIIPDLVKKFDFENLDAETLGEHLGYLLKASTYALEGKEDAEKERAAIANTTITTAISTLSAYIIATPEGTVAFAVLSGLLSFGGGKIVDNHIEDKNGKIIGELKDTNIPDEMTTSKSKDDFYDGLEHAYGQTDLSRDYEDLYNKGHAKD